MDRHYHQHIEVLSSLPLNRPTATSCSTSDGRILRLKRSLFFFFFFFFFFLLLLLLLFKLTTIWCQWKYSRQDIRHSSTQGVSAQSITEGYLSIYLSQFLPNFSLSLSLLSLSLSLSSSSIYIYIYIYIKDIIQSSKSGIGNNSNQKK